MRERVNISVSTDLHAELKAMAHCYGFSSVCGMAVTLLRLFAAYVRQAERMNEAETEADELNIERSITADFDGFTNWMRTPSGIVPGRKKRGDIERM